jgi:hypothetical protein
MRRVLEAAPADWRAERQPELDELTHEVQEKLERIERTRRALAAFLPQLQAIVRTLTAIEKARSADDRVRDAVAGARTLTLLGVGSVWDAAVPKRPAPAHEATPRRSLDKRVVIGAVLALLLLVGGAIALATGGGGRPSEPVVVTLSTPNVISVSVSAPTAVPAAPRLSPVQATFVEAQRATFYAISVAAPDAVSYAWRLTPPKDNPGCNKFGTVAGSPNKAVWHHADTDGCTHVGFQHDGTVTVTVTTNDWKCVATFFGTLSKSGPPAQKCVRA